MLTAVRLLAALAGFLSLSGLTVTPNLRKIDPLLSLPKPVAGFPSPESTEILSYLLRLPLRPIFIRTSFDDTGLPGKVAALGGTSNRVAPGIFTALIPPGAIDLLSNWETVTYLEAARKCRTMLDTSRPAVEANIVQDGSGSGLPTEFNGSGALVGIVDTGLDASNRDFYTGGNPSAPRAVCTGAPGEIPTIDEYGHGTHVAGIAAGNGFSSGGLSAPPWGVYTGMAPTAGIRTYKSSFYLTDIVNGISSLVNGAGASPISLNLSLGLMTGPHDGSSSFESSINSLAGNGPERRLISVAAGNEGDLAEHHHSVVPVFGLSAPVGITIPDSLDTAYSGSIEVWATGSTAEPAAHDEYTVTVVFPGSGNYVVAPSGAVTSSPSGAVTVSNHVDAPSNGATHISVVTGTSLAGLRGTMQFQRTRNGGNGTIDAYLDYSPADSPAAGFDTATASGTIIEPANGSNVVAVAAWNTHGNTTWGDNQALAIFSSIGPTRDGRRKPDVAAPGTHIRSARSRTFGADYSEGYAPNDNYAIMSGTSMAAPHSTGVGALVWSSNLSLTGPQMRERIRRTARVDSFVGAAPNDSWGNGKLDAYRAVSRPVAAISGSPRALPGATVTFSSANSSGGFGQSLSYSWSIDGTPTGTTASSTATLPSVPGTYPVRLTVSQSSPAGQDNDTLMVRVNSTKTVSLSGPSSSDNAAPASFTASLAANPDGQAITWRWVLVSRPATSGASLSASDCVATLYPDVSGVYLVGVRADDGLDNSALATREFTVGPLPSRASAGGGGGGCNSSGKDFCPGPDYLSLDALILSLIAAAIPSARNRFLRRSG